MYILITETKTRVLYKNYQTDLGFILECRILFPSLKDCKTFLKSTERNVKKNGFKAELMGRTRTVVQIITLGCSSCPNKDKIQTIDVGIHDIKLVTDTIMSDRNLVELLFLVFP